MTLTDKSCACADKKAILVARKNILGGGGGNFPIVSVYITTFYSFARSPLSDLVLSWLYSKFGPGPGGGGGGQSPPPPLTTALDNSSLDSATSWKKSKKEGYIGHLWRIQDTGIV